jgi:hypothetical protein
MSANASQYVVLSKFTTNMTLDEYTKSEIEDITSDARSKVMPGVTPINLSGIPGYQYVGTTLNHTFADNWVLQNGTVYRITFFFYQEVPDYSMRAVETPADQPYVRNMLSSFRIIQ